MTARVFSTAAIGLLAVGCAGTIAPRSESSSRQIEEMKARILELQRRAAVTDVEMARLRQQVADLEARQTRPATREVTEPSRDAVPLPAAPIPADTGEVEVSDLDLPSEPVAPPPDVTPSPPPAEPSVPPTVGYRPVAEEAQAVYDDGYTLFHRGQYLDAESSFQRFLQAYPDTELSDNAQYWIGESRYARGDLEGALAAFREMLARYPSGNKVPDALVKEGACLEGLGDREGARKSYDDVVRRYPGSAAAALAEERLAGLGGQ